jgi:hypothetical protein
VSTSARWQGVGHMCCQISWSKPSKAGLSKATPPGGGL